MTLSKQREAYRPLAVRGASLFFAMCDLQALSNMYRFSLTVLLSLFQKVNHVSLVKRMQQELDTQHQVALVPDLCHKAQCALPGSTVWATCCTLGSTELQGTLHMVVSMMCM